MDEGVVNSGQVTNPSQDNAKRHIHTDPHPHLWAISESQSTLHTIHNSQRKVEYLEETHKQEQLKQIKRPPKSDPILLLSSENVNHYMSVWAQCRAENFRFLKDTVAAWVLLLLHKQNSSKKIKVYFCFSALADTVWIKRYAHFTLQFRARNSFSIGYLISLTSLTLHLNLTH